MDLGGPDSDSSDHKPRPLPSDLPQSLDDRTHAPVEDYVRETEMYDGWQGECFRPSALLRHAHPLSQLAD